jgi:hypothetical protein
MRFMDLGCCLNRLHRLLLGKFLNRQPAQLDIHQRQELLRGERVTLLDAGQFFGVKSAIC